MKKIISEVRPVEKLNIVLPTSKSISNRMLIINALSGNKFNLQNLSVSDDTKVMLEGLKNIGGTIDIGHAGTSMRFLTAYLTLQGKETIITGSERMKNRPIAKLVEALRSLGADVDYVEKEGYPPLKIGVKTPGNKSISIPGNISSQYLTAILLIAPYLPNGLALSIVGELVSESYLRMTLELMSLAGIDYSWVGSEIRIEPSEYKPSTFAIEGDWSAASYWYQIACLMPDSKIDVSVLHAKSCQGDRACEQIFKPLGIETTFHDSCISLENNGNVTSFYEFDFINSPDLIQTVVVTCCLMGIPFRIAGAQTLRIKETDRILALQTELAKFGFEIKEPDPGFLTWDGMQSEAQSEILIETYHDHRMAMAFAPAAINYPNLIVNDPDVVSKSYPTYWDDLEKAGFIYK
jgi:3-phosphoshikimate 1-carboxyvinyltransferase